jgi:hypothetical protein
LPRWLSRFISILAVETALSMLRPTHFSKPALRPRNQLKATRPHIVPLYQRRGRQYRKAGETRRFEVSRRSAETRSLQLHEIIERWNIYKSV